MTEKKGRKEGGKKGKVEAEGEKREDREKERGKETDCSRIDLGDHLWSNHLWPEGSILKLNWAPRGPS